MKTHGILFIIGFLLFGCKDATIITRNKKISEATIDYDITFPYIEIDGLVASFLPNKMTMSIKDNSYSTVIKTYGGIFKSANFVDTKEKEFTQMLKVFKKKVTCDYNSSDMRKFIEEFPEFTLIPSNETETIAGYECKKVTGIFHDLTTPDIVIYYTDQFKIKNPNWCNPYSEIDGVMLAYDIEQFDTRARIVANNVLIEDVSTDAVTKENGYTEVNYESMKIEFEKIMDSFSI